jgi:polysaccharide biosynthesis protein PslJ
VSDVVDRALEPIRLRQRVGLPEGWRAYALFALMPTWWLLGLSHFIWIVLGLGMLLSLLLRADRIRIPRGFGIWIVFLGWMLASSLQIDTAGRLLGFGFRFSLYAAATILFLYLYNASPRRIPTSAIVNALAIYWVIVVIGGFLGMAFPNASFTTPAAHLIPASLASNAYVHDLVTARFAEVQGFLGYPIGRPQAFFTYTNGWGSGFALLVPFAFAALEQMRSWILRRALQAVLVLSLVPAVVSLNRGLWLSLVVSLGYVSLRFARRGDIRPFAQIVLCVIVGAVVVAFSPLGTLVSERFAHQHSNAARKALYAETFDRAFKSPLVGYGAPRPAESGGYLDSVGTQGQVLYLVFSHGFPALFLFLGWLAYALVHSRGGRSPPVFWAHVVILVGLIESAFYGITLQMIIIMAAAALAFRELQSEQTAPQPRAARERGCARRPAHALSLE